MQGMADVRCVSKWSVIDSGLLELPIRNVKRGSSGTVLLPFIVTVDVKGAGDGLSISMSSLSIDHHHGRARVFQLASMELCLSGVATWIEH
jgi:hypothetical protein